MAIQQKLYTANDLWDISHQETDYRYELIDGDKTLPNFKLALQDIFVLKKMG
jgi:hypothetical protein